MMKACLGLLAGAYALHFTSFTSNSDLFAFALFGIGFANLLLGRVAALFLVLGLALFLVQANRIIDSRLDERFEGDSMRVVIRVADFPIDRGSYLSFAAEPVNDQRVPGRVRLSWHQPEAAPSIGDVWQLEVRLKRPRGLMNPGGFDFEAWMFREGFGASGYVVNGKRNRLLGQGALTLLERLRRDHVERLYLTLPHPDVAAIIAAISVGARHRLGPEQWERFAATGTSHLMAISGLHVGLAATSAYFAALAACAVFRVSGNHRHRAIIAAIAAAALYTCLTGFAVPAQRALLMLTIAAGGLLRFRQPRAPTVLAAACIVVVVADPVSTMAPGFKLSFLAVAVIAWSALRTAGSGTARLAALQLTLLFGLAAVTALAFQRVALAAPAVNLLAIPLFSLVTVPAALLGVLLQGPFSAVGELSNQVAATSVFWLDRVLQHVASVPAVAFPVGRVTGIAWVALLLASAWAVIPPGWPARYVAWLALAILASHKPTAPPGNCVDLQLLDVGQGLSAVVRSASHVLVYDTGPAYPGGSSSATRTLIPFLRSVGVERIDRVVVSHSDIDHAGGVNDLTAAFEVGDILSGDALDASLAKAAEPCEAGTSWQWDGVRFEFLHPPGGHRLTGNDASCVLHISAGERSVLLTGDIGAEVESRLAPDLGRVDAVVVPHHGSDTSSAPQFVAALSPALALIPVGYRNRWDLPRESVVRRWRVAGAAVYSTDLHGAVGFRLCGASGVERLRSNRLERRRLWHAR